jgi:hypothetical protein
LIYLLGIAHSFQICAVKPFSKGGLDHFASRHLALRFESYLRDIIARLEPQVICEEYSNELILQKQAIDKKAYLVAQKVCQERNVCHIFCDPDRAERKALFEYHNTTEIEDEKAGYPIREGEWIKRMLPLMSRSPLLLICGAHHVATFGPQLLKRGNEISIVCEDLQKWFAEAS